MAAVAAAAQDPLLLFRACIASSSPPIPTTSADPTSGTDVADLPVATHILFNSHSASAGGPSHDAFPADTPTRFISSSSNADSSTTDATTGLDLLSVFWCWQNKDNAVGEYITATQSLNAARAANSLSPVTNLVFAEKLDLVNWLAGDVGENESEFIRALGDTAENRRLAGEAADLAKGDGLGDVDMVDGGDAQGSKDREGERLRAIYRQERKMGDRNTVLRGVKATVSFVAFFSSISPPSISFYRHHYDLTNNDKCRTFLTSANTQPSSCPEAPTASPRLHHP